MGIHKAFFLLKLRLLVLNCTIEVFLIFLIVVDPNIIIIKVDQRSLLIRCKKMVFFLIINSFKWLDWTVIKWRWTKVSQTRMTCL